MNTTKPKPQLLASVFNLLLIAPLLLGFVLRLRGFLSGRSLWLDEASLALGFVDAQLAELLLNPLPNFQSAPPGFIAMSFLLISVFGLSEFSVRILPLVASLASVVIVYLVSKKYLKNFIALAFLIGVFSLSPVLVYYASEFKQYSFDVLAVSFFVLTLNTNLNTLSKFQRALFIGFISLLVFSSLIAVPVFGIWLLSRFVISHGWKIKALVGFIRENSLVIFIPAVFIALHAVHIVINRKVDGMVQYWTNAGGLPPEDGVIGLFSWLPLRIANVLAEAFVSQQISLPRDELDPVISWLPILLLVIAGLVLRKSSESLFGLSLIAMAVVLSMLYIYPLGGRLSLFLIPITLLLAAKGIDALINSNVLVGSGLSLLLAGLLSINPVMTSGYYFLSPNENRDTKWALEVIEDNAFNSQLLLDFNNRKQVEVHQLMGFGKGIQTAGVSRALVNDPDWEVSDTVWLLSTHSISEMRKIRDELVNAGFKEQCLLEQDATMLSLLSKSSLECELTKP